MEYGAKHLMWAKIKEEPVDAIPAYDPAAEMGELVKVSDSPAFSEAKAAGDNNATARYIRRFQQCPVDVEVLDFTLETASSIFGAALSGEPKSELHFNANDRPPYGGLAFYTVNLLKGDVTRYQGVFYPKLKAVVQGKEFNTTGESVTLSGSKAQFMGVACASGDWKIQSPFFETEEEAVAWVDEKLPPAAEEAGGGGT